MPVAALNGIEINYERSGPEGASRVLFLNGSGSTLESARPILSVLGRHVDLVAHDQRGLGRTSIPAGPYRMADYATDAQALMDHLGWADCSVVGISFGGMVAQELAVTSPARVSRLALWCTSPGGVGGSSYPLQQLAELNPEERRTVGLRLLDTRFDDAWLGTHPSDAALVAARDERSIGGRTADQLLGEREQLAARAEHDVCDRLSAITCPTMVGCGRFDGIAPPSNAEAIVSRIPSATLRLYDGGHLFFAQDGRAFPELISFLTDQSPPEPSGTAPSGTDASGTDTVEERS